MKGFHPKPSRPLCRQLKTRKNRRKNRIRVDLIYILTEFHQLTHSSGAIGDMGQVGGYHVDLFDPESPTVIHEPVGLQCHGGEVPVHLPQILWETRFIEVLYPGALGRNDSVQEK